MKNFFRGIYRTFPGAYFFNFQGGAHHPLRFKKTPGNHIFYWYIGG